MVPGELSSLIVDESLSTVEIKVNGLAEVGALAANLVTAELNLLASVNLADG